MDILDVSDAKLKDLELKAEKARELVIETLLEAGSGHSRETPGGRLAYRGQTGGNEAGHGR